ncbi:hypothetical protein GUJ93_ZPchr0004g38317 [Zizania palustris]|uniref:Uncharacterized protein n=1 Tax=Zizania palustris TaxID=103762 RepID=A0A8J5VGB2_ZIZPA|nr:hypothetical protein GUJ93_ZPchr0004g38317 [Zizania palustris]
MASRDVGDDPGAAMVISGTTLARASWRSNPPPASAGGEEDSFPRAALGESASYATAATRRPGDRESEIGGKSRGEERSDRWVPLSEYASR